MALANGSAEILVSMGLEKEVVGRDVASTTPALESVPIVTSGHQLIPEKVIALKPDLVIIDASTGPANALTVIRKSGIKIVKILEAWTLADISKKVLAVGRAVAAPNTAKDLAEKINSTIGKLSADATIHPKIAFLYLRGTNSIYLMGGPGSGADSLIAALGAKDVGAATLPHAFNSLTSEALVTAQPDILLLMTKGLESVGGVKGLLDLPGIAQTPAGKYRRIITVDDSLLLSFGPRTPGLVVQLAKDVATVMDGK